jgi:hypothetical protein
MNRSRGGIVQPRLKARWRRRSWRKGRRLRAVAELLCADGERNSGDMTMSDHERGTLATMQRLSVILMMAMAASSCGGALPGVRSDCPAGQTTLDGTCVTQQIADYVGCVRATGATVASDSAKSLSAAAGLAGVTASTQGEVKDKLEKRYGTVSDQNALEIVRDCNTKTASRAEVVASDSETAAAPSQAAGPSLVPARAQAEAQPESSSNAANAFAGNWTCTGGVDLAFLRGARQHVQGTGPWLVVDNGDGTIAIINAKQPDDGQCPQGRWLVKGSTAKPVIDPPCHKADGSVVRALRGDATLSGNALAVNFAAAVSGTDNPVQVIISMRCAR